MQACEQLKDNGDKAHHSIVFLDQYCPQIKHICEVLAAELLCYTLKCTRFQILLTDRL